MDEAPSHLNSILAGTFITGAIVCESIAHSRCSHDCLHLSISLRIWTLSHAYFQLPARRGYRPPISLTMHLPVELLEKNLAPHDEESLCGCSPVANLWLDPWGRLFEFATRISLVGLTTSRQVNPDHATTSASLCMSSRVTWFRAPYRVGDDLPSFCQLQCLRIH